MWMLHGGFGLWWGKALWNIFVWCSYITDIKTQGKINHAWITGAYKNIQYFLTFMERITLLLIFIPMHFRDCTVLQFGTFALHSDSQHTRCITNAFLWPPCIADMGHYILQLWFLLFSKLNGGQPNIARCLAIYWACTLCIHFWGLLPLTELCQVQNSLGVQVLCSLILAVLLHGTPAAGVSQTAAWYTEWNNSTFVEGATYIRLGGHHAGHWPTF